MIEISVDQLTSGDYFLQYFKSPSHKDMIVGEYRDYIDGSKAIFYIQGSHVRSLNDGNDRFGIINMVGLPSNVVSSISAVSTVYGEVNLFKLTDDEVAMILMEEI